MQTYEEVNQVLFGVFPFSEYTGNFLNLFQADTDIHWNFLRIGFLVCGIGLYMLNSFENIKKSSKKGKAQYKEYLEKYALNEFFGVATAISAFTYLMSIPDVAETFTGMWGSFYGIMLIIFAYVMITILSCLYFAHVLIGFFGFLVATSRRFNSRKKSTKTVTKTEIKSLESKHKSLNDEWSNYFEDYSDPRLSALLEASVKADDARDNFKKYPKNRKMLNAYAKAIDDVETEFIKTEVDDD